MYCRKETGGAFGRRLITLLFAGWLPHDTVFVAEAPLSLIGRWPEPAQALHEGFPDRGCAPLLAYKYGVFCITSFFPLSENAVTPFQVCQEPK